MSEASFDTVLQQLRDTAPRAPERLQHLVRAMPVAPPPRTLRIRPALAAAATIAVAAGLGAAIIGGFTGSSKQQAGRTVVFEATGRAQAPSGTDQAEQGRFAPSLTS